MGEGGIGGVPLGSLRFVQFSKFRKLLDVPRAQRTSIREILYKPYI